MAAKSTTESDKALKMDSLEDKIDGLSEKNVDKSAIATESSEFRCAVLEELTRMARFDDPVTLIVGTTELEGSGGTRADSEAEVVAEPGQGFSSTILDALVFDDKLKRQIVEAGCIVPLVDKLRSPTATDQCKAFAAGYLASLALSADIRREITTTAAMPLLINLAEHSLRADVQEMATLSLFVLAKDADARRQICNHHGVRTLLNLSNSDASSHLCKDHCRRTLDSIQRDPALACHVRDARYDLT